mgnify:CR=1 FL=1
MATSGTNITAIAKPGVGTTAGPEWATNLNTSLDAVDDHDHSTNKGIRITPAAINVNSDFQFNENSATELKNVIFSTVTAATTSYSLYQASGNLYWRNGSGSAVQVTIGTAVNSGAGSISGMTGTDAGASYADGSKTFNFFTDSGNSDYGKMAHADLLLFKYTNDNSGDTDYVTIAANSGVSGSSGTLYVPSENGTFLTTATSYAGAIAIATSSGNSNIDLTPHGTGEVNISKVDINGGTLGAFTIDGNWTAASQTCANLGTVTTTGTIGLGGKLTAGSTEIEGSNFDINGGSIDGTAIGVASHTTGKFTTVDATTDFTIGGTVITNNTITDDGTLVIAASTATSFSDGNITNVGDISLDTISSDAGTSIGVTLGTDAGDDFNVGSLKLIVEGDTGNVGIGKSPSAWHTTYNGIELSHSSGGGHSFYNRYIDSATSLVGIVQNAYPTGSGGFTSILAEQSARFEMSQGALAFHTAPANGAGGALTMTNRMTILNDGKVGIGTTNPGVTLANISGTGSNVSVTGIYWNAGAASEWCAQFRNGVNSNARGVAAKLGAGTPGTGDYYYGMIADDGNLHGNISGNGSGGVQLNSTSDYRLKENIVDLTNGITRLQGLKPRRFNFKKNEDATVDGFIAHEVSDYVPEAVSGEKDAMRMEKYVITPAVEAVIDAEGNITTEAVKEVKGEREAPDFQMMDQTKLIPLLVGALQEAIARIETLENA